MATIAQIREGIATNLATIADVQVSAYMLAQPTPPAIHVLPGEISYDRASARGLDEVMMLVQAFVAFSSDIGAQKRLDTMLAPSGAGSVKAAIESDPTLGGTVSDLHVRSASGYRSLLVEGRGLVLVVEWTVYIMA